MRFLNSIQPSSNFRLKPLTLVLSLLPLTTQAATIVVNSTYGGSGALASCSLADAITAANTGSNIGGCSTGSIGSDDIIFDSALNNSTINLTANLPPITDDLTVTGLSGTDVITVSGGNAHSIFIVQGVRLNLSNLVLTEGYGTAVGTSIGNTSPNNGGAIAALSGALVTLDNCTLSDNSADNRGGAVYAESSSSVSLNNCIITNNSAYVGGGISTFSGAYVDVMDSTLSNNSSVSASGWGGAITAGGSSLQGSSVNVRNSVFSNNSTFTYGGAIMANWGSTVDVLDSTFTDNSAFTAGAIQVQNEATMNVSRSSFSSNSAFAGYGGAIGVEVGTLNVLNCTFSNNSANNGGGALFSYAGTVNLNTVMASDNYAGSRGGAIYVLGHPSFPNSSLQMTRSFLSDNTAGQYGGAMVAENNVFVTVSDTTMSNNSANQRGGAVLVDGSILEVSNSTVSGNNSGTQGGAVYVNNGASVKLSNSTLAENIGGSVFTFNSSGTMLQNTVIAGGNCDLDSSSAVILNGVVHIDDGTCGATLTGPSQLEPLAYTGAGPIPTHKPIPGSPLIDQGVGGAGNNPAADQRGYNRIVGVAIDIGSVELQDPPMFMFNTYNLSAFLETLTVGQSISVDLDDYISNAEKLKITITAKDLPTGLTIDSSTNVLSGTPQKSGVFTTEFTVEDDTGSQLNDSIKITVEDGRLAYKR